MSDRPLTAGETGFSYHSTDYSYLEKYFRVGKIIHGGKGN